MAIQRTHKVTNEQMEGLFKYIVQMTPFSTVVKKFLVYIFSQTENFTKTVLIILSQNQLTKEIRGAVHTAVSSNHNIKLHIIRQLVGTDKYLTSFIYKDNPAVAILKLGHHSGDYDCHIRFTSANKLKEALRKVNLGEYYR